MKNLLRTISLLSCCVAVMMPGAAWAGDGFHTVRLRLKWHHQFQSAGYYVALHKGFYRTNNLEVMISEAQKGENPVDMVLSGDVEFAVASSGLVIQRMKGRSVVALASLFQHSPLLLVTQDTKELETPAGLLRARVMVEPDADELHAFLRRNQIPIESMNVLDHDSPVAAFKSKKIDAFTAYATDELFALNESNIPYCILPLTSSALGHYSDVLFTSQDLIERDPPIVRAFRRASLQGWKYAFEHIEEAISLIEDKYGVTKGVPALTFEAEEMLKRAKPPNVQIGDMNVQKWTAIADSYAAMGMAPPNASIDGFVFGESYRSRKNSALILIPSCLFILFLALFIVASDYLTAFVRQIVKKWRHRI